MVGGTVVVGGVVVDVVLVVGAGVGAGAMVVPPTGVGSPISECAGVGPAQAATVATKAKLTITTFGPR